MFGSWQLLNPEKGIEDDMSKEISFVCSIAAILSTVSVALGGTYSGGDGTWSDPYRIATKADLLELAANTADYTGVVFALTADIDMEGQVFTTAIIAADTSSSGGFQGTIFRSTFDGNGHKITNFVINGGSNDFVGLFDYILNSVKNLGLENYAVSGHSWVGGLAGYSQGGISDCYSTGTVSGYEYVGGLVGVNYGSISDCYSTGTVNGSNYVGGLVGYNMYYSISNCYSTGAVSGASAVGGLLGYNYYGSVSSSFWDTETCFPATVGVGSGTSTGVTGKTTAEMKTLSTFTDAGWDFMNTWLILEGITYPQLQWQGFPGDIAGLGGVDFVDYALLSQWWGHTDCGGNNNNCDGADINLDGKVWYEDLLYMINYWLSGR
jgi:hypothetical protein